MLGISSIFLFNLIYNVNLNLAESSANSSGVLFIHFCAGRCVFILPYVVWVVSTTGIHITRLEIIYLGDKLSIYSRYSYICRPCCKTLLLLFDMYFFWITWY